MPAAKPPIAVITEDEPVLARTLQRLLAEAWPVLMVAGVAEDSPKATERPQPSLAAGPPRGCKSTWGGPAFT